MLHRVVITGLGAVTPLGHDVPTFWRHIVAGRSGVAPITRYGASLFRTQFASELKNYAPGAYLSHADIKRTDRFTQYALIAADQAIADSGFDMSQMDPFDVGVIWSGQCRPEMMNRVKHHARLMWSGMALSWGKGQARWCWKNTNMPLNGEP